MTLLQCAANCYRRAAELAATGAAPDWYVQKLLGQARAYDSDAIAQIKES